MEGRRKKSRQDCNADMTPVNGGKKEGGLGVKSFRL